MRAPHRLRAALVAALLSLGLAGCGEDDEDERAPPPPPASAFDIDHAAEVAALGGDPARGERLFRPCSTCHRIDQEAHRTGPHLVGLFGRLAGSEPGYSYSAASRDSQAIWRVGTLSDYLRDPRGFMPGTKMNYPGVTPEDLPDLIAYLYQAGGEAPRP